MFVFSVYLSAIQLGMFYFICLVIGLNEFFVYLSAWVCACYLSDYPYAYLSHYKYACLCVCLYIDMLICLLTCIFVCLNARSSSLYISMFV